MPTITHLPSDVNLTRSLVGVGEQDGETKQFIFPPGAVNLPATLDQIRAGISTINYINCFGLSNELNAIFNDTSHAWDEWATASVVQRDTNDYGTQLISDLITGADGAGHSLVDIRLLTTSTTLYGDMNLVYNGGLAAGIQAPVNADAEDGQWELAVAWRATNSSDTQGAGLWMMIHWKGDITRIYHSTSVSNPSWTEIPDDDDLFVHRVRGIPDGSGWLVVRPDADELPPFASGNDDFTAEPWVMKRVGNTLHAVALSSTNSYAYRIATSTREWHGRGQGARVEIVDSAAEMPSDPPVDTIVIIRTAFGSYSVGQRLYYNGTTYVNLPTPQAVIGVGSVALTALSTAGSSTGQVVTRTSTGIAWQTPAAGGSGSGHPHTVSAGIQNVPDSWAVNDWVYNTAENSITLGRGTDDNNPLDRKSIYRITAFGTNSLDLNKILLHGSTIVGQRSIDVNKWSAGSATNGQVAQVATIGGTKQVVFGNLPSNSVGYTQINDPSKAANRILHYNAAGTGITSSPHSDFDIDATQLTSGIIPPARYGTNIPAANLSGQIGTDNLPTTIPLDNIPVLDSSKFPADIAAGVADTDDADSLWHSVGVYSYNPGADGTPSTFEGGFLFSHHNAQNALQMDGREYHRQRNVNISGPSAPVNLRSNTTFTRITDMTFNLNNIDTDAEYGFYTWDKSNADDTGNTAGTDRPVNSPSYSSGTFLAQDGVAIAECRETYQIVKSGRSELNDAGDLYYRLKNTGAWGSWSAIDFQQPYTGTPDLQLPSVLPILKARGLKVATELRQIHQPASGDGDIWLLIPPGNLAHHPAILSQTLTTASRAPIFVQWAWVSGVLQLRVYYTYGSDLIGNAAVAEGRRQSVSYTRTATTWAITNDSVTGGSYNSGNGTISLTQQYGSGLSITGLPYVVSS